ncbi:MAG: hypothetical protein ACRET4_00445 [Steroidobacteraceae bacterium]
MSLLRALNLRPPTQAAPAASAATAVAGKSASVAAQIDRLLVAAEAWREVHRQADERIAALKSAVKAHYAGRHPALVKEIELGLAKLDGVLDIVDHRLADTLASAGAAKDDAARKAELSHVKTIIAQYITYVKSEPLVAHMDNNPFGVKTDLRTLLAGGLAGAAKAIG